MLRQKIDSLGVTVHTSKQTEQIATQPDGSLVLHFADGGELATDLVLFSAGIRPRDELARSADISVGPRGGITINDQCQTSDSDIYAIGECALWNGQILAGSAATRWRVCWPGIWRPNRRSSPVPT